MRQATHAYSTRRAVLTGLAAAVPTAALAAPGLSAEPDGRITELFRQWQPAVWRAEAEDGDFLRAFRAEHALRKAIGQSPASSLRELQMLAFADTSDGAGIGGLAHAERMLADDIAWVAEHGRDASYFPWRIPAFALAVPLMRMAMADPNGPRQPTTPLPEV